MARLRFGGFKLLDTQFANEHLKQFGVTEVPRKDFRKRLAHAISTDADLHLAERSLPMAMDMLASL
jgi:leucyl/phenylalanyl-tRNA--protein transferase